MSGWDRKRREGAAPNEISMPDEISTSDETFMSDETSTTSGATDLGAPPPDSQGAIDLSALQADEALLDALGRPDPDLSGHDDQELASLLLAWRQEADSEPISDLVDTDLAMAVIASARSTSVRRRHRFLVPVATAAAVLAIAFTGVGVAAKSAEPGDTLWSLTKVLYSEHARSVEAASTIQDDLRNAREAMGAGRLSEARVALDRAKKALGSVSGDDGKANLTDKQKQLTEQLDGTSPDTGGSAEPPGSATGESPKPSAPATITGSPIEPPVSPSASPPVEPTSPPPPSPSGTAGSSDGSGNSAPPHRGRPHSSRQDPPTSHSSHHPTGTNVPPAPEAPTS